jgi:hypothetical protein
MAVLKRNPAAAQPHDVGNFVLHIKKLGMDEHDSKKNEEEEEFV